jgi:hypothetical protein
MLYDFLKQGIRHYGELVGESRFTLVNLLNLTINMRLCIICN